MFRSPDNIVILVIVSIWLLVMWRTTANDIKKKRETFVSPEMFRRVAGHQPTRRPVFKWGLVIVAVLLLALAMMRPVGSLYEEEVFGEGLDLVVALDLSRSMHTHDIENVSRLEVAKAILSQLMKGLRNDRVALVVFAGEAMVQSPLSHDKNTFLTFLDRADPKLLSRQGTNIAEAIETSIDRFDMVASQSKVIILLSDGEDPDQERLKKAVDEAARKKIPVFTVGLGSEKGGPIPEGRTWYGEVVYRRHEGKVVVSRLNDTNLREIAEKTSAAYFRASDVASARDVIAGLNEIPRIAMAGGTRQVRHELYFYPVLLAFLLLLIEWIVSERIPYAREKDHWLKRI